MNNVLWVGHDFLKCWGFHTNSHLFYPCFPCFISWTTLENILLLFFKCLMTYECLLAFASERVSYFCYPGTLRVFITDTTIARSYRQSSFMRFIWCFCCPDYCGDLRLLYLPGGSSGWPWHPTSLWNSSGSCSSGFHGTACLGLHEFYQCVAKFVEQLHVQGTAGLYIPSCVLKSRWSQITLQGLVSASWYHKHHLSSTVIAAATMNMNNTIMFNMLG